MASIFKKFSEWIFRLRSGAIELSNRRYEREVKRINQLGESMRTYSETKLQQEALSLRDEIKQKGASHDLTLRFFAIAREVCLRCIGLRPYDVQLLAALALQEGKLVEMQTGEGKTLAAVLPACLRALSGHGVHVLTYNDYLAQRDAREMSAIYHFFGLSVGHICQGMTTQDRKQAYQSDVTYVTASEAGFDYLRDQLRTDDSQAVQRGFHYAIVDEADSIMIDESRVPMVLAGEDGRDESDLHQLANEVRSLRHDIDYTVGKGRRNVSFNQPGLDHLQNALGCGELFDEQNVDLLTRLNLALQAETLLQRDVDYLVRNDKIELIDELTGRVAENRRWPYGLQAAIEAKEKLDVQPQGYILKSITLLHFLQLYDSLSGMTGTAKPCASELWEFYDLKTVVIPPNRPGCRVDHEDRVYASKADKHAAVVAEIKHEHRHGRPILVGTSSVEESEQLAAQLLLEDIECSVLNAKQDHVEANIIAAAGSLGAITISTNMAGRGTDIRLGGRDQNSESEVVALGGLYVIGTNRHESRRIDDQLRGRAGRQGDPGQSRFFVSVEDDLLKRCGVGSLDINISELQSAQPSRRDASVPQPISDPKVGKRIARVQRFIEGESFDIRRTLRSYTTGLENHRQLMNTRRNELLLATPCASLLQSDEPELHALMVTKHGTKAIQEVEKEITLFQIDQCWADHLAHVAEIRNSIHLTSMGGFNALDEFNERINKEFRDFIQRVDREVVAILKQLALSKNETDLSTASYPRPSATWTYMINDSPTGDLADRLASLVNRIMKPPASPSSE